MIVWDSLVILPKIVKRIRERSSVEMYDVSGRRRGFYYDVTLLPGAASITPAKCQLCRDSSSHCCHPFPANGITIEMPRIAQFCKIMKSGWFRIQLNCTLKPFDVSGTHLQCCRLSTWRHIRFYLKVTTKTMWRGKEQAVAPYAEENGTDPFLAVPTSYGPNHFRPDLAFIFIKRGS
jgi:hypothetical protein